MAGKEATRTSIKLEQTPLDLILFVGKEFYTIESFTEESRRLGCCKRINGFPSEIVIGKSRVFLAHDTSLRDSFCPECGSEMVEFQQLPNLAPDEQGFQINDTTFDAHCLNCDYSDDVKNFVLQRTERRVFGYYTIKGIEAILSKGMSREELEAKGVKIIDKVTVANRPKRGCGMQLAGGFYLVSSEDMDKLREDVSKGDFSGALTLIDPSIQIQLKRFRGYKYVLGDNILARKPEVAWFNVAETRNQNSHIRITKKRGYVQNPLEVFK